MAITDEQLQRYWSENPQELEKAVASNPGMFGLSSQQDFNVGMTGAASQRPNPINVANQFADINTRYDDIFANANQTATNLLQEQYQSPEWQNFANAYTATGGNVAPEDLPTNTNFFGALENFAPTADYRAELDTLLQTSGMPPVKKEDGKLYAISTGRENGFTDLGYLPQGYQFAEGDRVPGQYYRIEEKPASTFDYIKPILNAASGMLLGNALGPVLGAAGSGAVGGGASAAIGGGSAEDIARGALTGGLTAGISGPSGPFSGMTEGVIRSGLESGAVEALGQAIQGDFDIGDILTSAALGGVKKGATDFVGDYLQTSEYTPERVSTLLSEGVITGDEADRLNSLYQTSDVGALFGPNAFLNNTFGIGSELRSTQGLDRVMQTIGSGVDLLLNNPVGQFIADNPVTKAVLDGAAALMGVANPTAEQVKEFMNSNYNVNDPKSRAQLDYDLARKSFELGPNTLLPENERYDDILGLGPERYDERFFVADSPRSDISMEGIFLENPYTQETDTEAERTATTPSSGTGSASQGSESTLPSQEDTDGELADILERLGNIFGSSTSESDLPSEDVGTLEPDEDLMSGTVPGDDIVDGDGDLPSGGTIGTIEQDLPASTSTGSIEAGLPSSSTGVIDNNLPSSTSTGSIEDRLPRPSAGGGGGGGGRKRLGLGDLSKEQAKDFMANIEYIVPMLQQMNIPLEDFLVMWMNRK